MKPTVLLFDIDGTLVSTGGAGRRSIERAFAEHLGGSPVLDFSFAGMTDPAIVRRGLTNAGRDVDAEAIAAVLRVYVRVLEEEIEAAHGFVVHAGIERAIDVARGKRGFRVGLGTGNIKEGAKVKLGRANLHDRFTFGGFGCDSEDRAELIRIGADRGAAELGVPRSECRVVVIGDTPKDVAAAIAIGAESIGVGTGPFSAADLIASGATWAFASMESDGAMEALVGEE